MRGTLRVGLIALVAAAFVSVLAVGLGRDPRLLPSARIAEPAPSFGLIDLAGRRFSSEALRGRPAVINFWASWCSECKKEHPLLMQAHERWGRAVAFVGVVFDDSPANARAFLRSRGEPAGGGYPNLIDPGSRVAIDFGVYGVPETFFIDRRGRIVGKQVGRVDRALLARWLEELTAA